MTLRPAYPACLAVVAILVSCGSGEEPASPRQPPEGAVAGAFETTPCVHMADEKKYGAECGTLRVPENRRDPDTRLIALSVTRIPASGEASAEPIFWLGGGPGSSNLGYRRVEWFHENHDIVLVGNPGIDGSVYLGGPEIGEALASGLPMMSRECIKMQGEAAAAGAERLKLVPRSPLHHCLDRDILGSSMWSRAASSGSLFSLGKA